MIERAILKINPKAEFTINGGDIDNIEWVNGTKPISKSDIEAQFSAVELELALDSLRNIRNELLAATDWCALSDVTMSDDMKTYRQALRDISKHSNWPNITESDWPTKP